MLSNHNVTQHKELIKLPVIWIFATADKMLKEQEQEKQTYEQYKRNN